MTRERLRELAFNVATANGVLRAFIALGRPSDEAERGYQTEVAAFDAAIDELFWRLSLYRRDEEEKVNQ